MTLRNSRVFFYVQHLLGIGHLRRAAILCRALSEGGFDVTLAMGGRPVGSMDIGGAELLALPPLHIGADGFHDLVDVNDVPVDAVWKDNRRDLLLDAIAERSPDILITEAFPFGRRQMRFELIPILESAKSAIPRPLIVCSVRDILKSSRKPGRAEETRALIAEFYDLVLVHGDASFARLEETFPEAGAFAPKLRYTGVVAERNGILPPAGEAEVLISAGGGAVGIDLFKTAIAARSLSRLAGLQWRLLVGPNVAEVIFSTLSEQALEGVMVERYRTDFRRLLAGASVSVSQAGYNTVADILSTNTPAVLVPFDTDGEDEQPRRAQKLAQAGRTETIASSHLTPQRLADAIDRVAMSTPSSEFVLDMGGATNTVSILRQALERHD
ncbi:MAG: glycosyltransferase family protein [Alphaproteobacteria bacterium]